LPDPQPDEGSFPPLRDIIDRYELRARKSLGQNFLLDLNLTRRIARAAGDISDCTVIEIGPGPGGLTRALLDEGAKQIIAVERDKRCLEALKELRSAFPDRLALIEGDALKVTPQSLVGETEPLRIIANLPYNVATELLFMWLVDARRYLSLTLMFQKEVAMRIVAAPGSKTYGRLSVMTQWLCETKLHFDIPARAFTPAPKVTSSLVGLTPRPHPLAPADRKALTAVTVAAFGQRRKMLRGSLKSLGCNTGMLIEKAGIEGTRRAEELSVEEFCRLARVYAELGKT
jgi:16S rRNA (adenine1518-N6/adenine1519-N6)-dimethyltransferase